MTYLFNTLFFLISTEDIESEDDSNAPAQSTPNSDSDEESEDSELAVIAASKGMGKGKKPMTARQAVLASAGSGSVVVGESGLLLFCRVFKLPLVFPLCFRFFLYNALWVNTYACYNEFSAADSPLPSITSKKKKYLTETEIALRREETARKRKNLSEKKLEDEKVSFYSISG